MAGYKLRVRTPAAAAGAAFADIRASATDRCRIIEVKATLVAATSTSIGVIRSASVGTANTTQFVQACDPADPAGTALIGTAWSVAPTIAGTPAYLDGVTLPATIGAGVVFTFSPVVALAISTSLLLWNFGGAAGSALDLTITLDE